MVLFFFLLRKRLSLLNAEILFFYYLPVFFGSLSNVVVKLILPQAVRIFYNLWPLKGIENVKEELILLLSSITNLKDLWFAKFCSLILHTLIRDWNWLFHELARRASDIKCLLARGNPNLPETSRHDKFGGCFTLKKFVKGTYPWQKKHWICIVLISLRMKFLYVIGI